MRILLVTLILATLTACGGGSATPTAPSTPATDNSTNNSGSTDTSTDNSGTTDNTDTTDNSDNSGTTTDTPTDPMEALLATLTLEQKVAQMIQAEIGYISLDDIRQYGIGSVLNGGGAYPYGNRAASASDWLNFAKQLRAASLDTSQGSAGIPIIWGTDAVHGHNNLNGATLFPHNIGLGAANNPALIYDIAVATAKEVGATGVDWTFAPTVAQAQDYRWGRTYESYSDDNTLVKDYAAAMVNGLQSQGIAATAKHFIGDGGTRGGTDQGNTLATNTELLRDHASGYEGAIGAQVMSAMASFNSINGKKVHGERDILTGMLREQLGFEGMVVSDWHGVAQVAGCSTDSCAQAINAGIDMIMAPDSWLGLLNNTVQQVRNGQISQARIDEAVLRILRMKESLGMFDDTFDPARAPASVVGSDEHRALARRAVRESLVLLKNNNQVLPLDPSQHILVVGAAANSLPQQAGGWSVSWQGTGTSNSDFPGATTLLAGFSEAVTAAQGNFSYSIDAAYSTRPDAAIVVFGEQPYAEGAGDLSNLAYSNSDLSLNYLRALQADGIPTVAVFLTGRPRWVNEWLNASDAFVVAWLPGTEGAGVADVLLQDRNSPTFDTTGRLPFAWPGGSVNPSDAQAPVAADLFERGFGLSLSDNTTLVALSTDPNNSVSGIVAADSTASDNNGTTNTGNNTPQEALWVLRNGAVETRFEGGIKAFDEALGFGECVNDNGAACPSIDWAWVSDTDRGQVLEVSHPSSAQFAGLFIDTTSGVDASQYANGVIAFDILHMAGENQYTMKLDCFWPCTSGHLGIGAVGDSAWQTVEVPLTTLQNGGLNLNNINTGLVIWATNHNGSRFRLDNIRFMEASQ